MTRAQLDRCVEDWFAEKWWVLLRSGSKGTGVNRPRTSPKQQGPDPPTPTSAFADSRNKNRQKIFDLCGWCSRRKVKSRIAPVATPSTAALHHPRGTAPPWKTALPGDERRASAQVENFEQNWRHFHHPSQVLSLPLSSVSNNVNDLLSSYICLYRWNVQRRSLAFFRN